MFASAILCVSSFFLTVEPSFRLAANSSAAILFDDPEARRHFTDACHMDAEGAGMLARRVSEAIERHERARPSLPRAGTQTAAQAH